MNRKLLLALVISASVFGLLAQTPAKSAETPGWPTNEVVTGKVEAVFDLVDTKGFRFVAYQVKYQGTFVIAVDPTSKSHHSVGEVITFLASRQDLTSFPAMGTKILTFVVSKQKA